MDSEACMPSKHPSVTWRRMGDESVLLHISSENYYSLNEVGTRIWELIDGHTTPAQIAAQVADEYEAPVEEIQADVDVLLRELRAQELLI